MAQRGYEEDYWYSIFQQFQKSALGKIGFYCVLLFCFFGIYAPFFASSKPFAVNYDGSWFFPFFRYLFFSGFYTKKLDIFFNLLMFTLPAFILAFWLLRRSKLLKFFILALTAIQIGFFFYFGFFNLSDPASDPNLAQKRQQAIQAKVQEKNTLNLVPIPPEQDWQFDLNYMNDYAKLNTILRYIQRKEHHAIIKSYAEEYIRKHGLLPTLWQMDENRVQEQVKALETALQENEDKTAHAFQTAALYLEACHSLNAVGQKYNCNNIADAPNEEKKELQSARDAIQAYFEKKERLAFYEQRRIWLEQNSKKIRFNLMPPVPFHWEDDVGGDQRLNQYLPWWELTRSNRKDLMAALIFGIRISLVVGFLAVALAVLIGVPIGAFAGFYGGKFDIIVSRLLEIWESMPTFFMLLLVIAITQSKSIFIVITVIGVFAWTTFSRYTRGEFFKQRNLSYVEASKAVGFGDLTIIFKDILPNAIPPLLTLLPFAIMGAITSEAGLSFLGLGEDGSCSWGVLMDEGRRGFPSEAYLLWPPAILLTILLVAIALVGDALRDALDPKLKT